MKSKKSLLQIWKAKGQILEGIANSIFKKEHVEEIATERMAICEACPVYDADGQGCAVPGTAPCCNQNKQGCGCSLYLKTRALSTECPLGKWSAVLTQEEEDLLQADLNRSETN